MSYFFTFFCFLAKFFVFMLFFGFGYVCSELSGVASGFEEKLAIFPLVGFSYICSCNRFGFNEEATAKTEVLSEVEHKSYYNKKGIEILERR